MIEKLDAAGVRFVRGEVIKINAGRKRVQVAGGDFDGEISYDYLVIAAGRRLATEKIDGFFEHSHHLLGIKSAIEFGAAVESFTAGNIVVGLAPEASLPIPVCETAFALARKFAAPIKKKQITVSAVFPETLKKAFGGADLHRQLEKAFAAHRIALVSDFAVKEITEKQLISVKQQRIEYDLLMLVPPFRGQTLLGDERWTDDAGFIKVNDFMRVENETGIYAVGDIAAFPGPKLAFMAVRQAQIAAENIVSEIRGRLPAKTYRHELAFIIDQGGENALFLHYGVWDQILYGLKEGKMWSRIKRQHNQLWEMARDG